MLDRMLLRLEGLQEAQMTLAKSDIDLRSSPDEDPHSRLDFGRPDFWDPSMAEMKCVAEMITQTKDTTRQQDITSAFALLCNPSWNGDANTANTAAYRLLRKSSEYLTWLRDEHREAAADAELQTNAYGAKIRAEQKAGGEASQKDREQQQNWQSEFVAQREEAYDSARVLDALKEARAALRG
jgi:PPE-repeat protein